MDERPRGIKDHHPHVSNKFLSVWGVSFKHTGLMVMAIDPDMYGCQSPFFGRLWNKSWDFTPGSTWKVFSWKDALFLVLSQDSSSTFEDEPRRSMQLLFPWQYYKYRSENCRWAASLQCASLIIMTQQVCSLHLTAFCRPVEAELSASIIRQFDDAEVRLL